MLPGRRPDADDLLPDLDQPERSAGPASAEGHPAAFYALWRQFAFLHFSCHGYFAEHQPPRRIRTPHPLHRRRPLKLLIAGGGTGGHVIPALVVAREFCRRDPTRQVLFVGTSR